MSPDPLSLLRCRQVRLRTLLFAVAALSVIFGFGGKHLRDARRQRQAVLSVRAAGGKVFYDWQIDRLPGDIEYVENWQQDDIPLQRNTWSRPARRILGNDVFDEVVGVWFNKRVSSDELQSLDNFPNLKRLVCYSVYLDEAALQELKELKQVSSIDISELLCDRKMMKELQRQLPQARFTFVNQDDEGSGP